MRFFLKISYLVSFLFGTASLHSQNLLVNASFENDLSNWDSRIINTIDYGATFGISATEQYSGAKCAHINVSKVKSDYWAFRYHNIRLKQSGFSLQNGDIVRLRFWAKVNTTDLHPMIQAGLARNASEVTDFWLLEDYDMSNFLISSNWKQYEMNLFVTKNVGNDVMFLLRVGGMTGDYYIDDMELEVVKSVASEMNWLDHAQNRIDTLRKADLTLIVQDKFGTIIPQTDVSVKLLRHNFQWGTAVRSGSGAYTSSTGVWERARTLEMFNTIVHESDFKWPQVEPSRNSPTYSLANKYIDWKSANNLQLRGHALYWTKYDWMPTWWNNLTSDTARINALKTRCTRDVAYFKGRVAEYDVVNEPTHFPYVEDLVGDSIYRKTFQWANESDPQAKLYVNDWWNVDKWDSWRLRKWVETRVTEGADLHGIGLQAHWDNERIDWLEVKLKSDYLAETGLPLKITEFDMDSKRIGMSEIELAEDYGKMMRLAFSHPSYDGFLIWGLLGGWRGTANPTGIYFDDAYNTPRMARDTMFHLIKNVWTTNVAAKSTLQGECNFNGYFGDYQMDIAFGGEVKTYFVNFAKNSTSKVLTTDFNYTTNAIITPALSELSLRVYPNPAHEIINVDIPHQSNSKAKVLLYNEQGGVVYSYLHPQGGTIPIHLGNVSTGIYFVSVEIDNKVLQKKILIK